MTFGLMGFECESPNKGCEALAYSFVSILKKVCNRPFSLFIFTNDSIDNFAEYYHDIEIVRIPLKIKDVNLSTIRAMKKCDFIFDVTLGDSFSDIYSKGQCISNLRFKTLAEFICKKYVLLPQTYGPFLDQKIKRWSASVIKKAFRVYSRDARSKEYIHGLLPSREVIETTDLAFILPYKVHERDNQENLRVGVNVSGLLWKGGFIKDNQFGLNFDYREFIEKTIIQLKKSNAEIHLIPHVIDMAENSYDDDYKKQKELSQRYDVVLAPAFRNPIQAKSYIATMDFFIGSRMHSTIAALSCGVPTLPVSYSRKFEGLFESIDYPYIIHGNSDSLAVALDKVENALNRLLDIKEKVVKSQEKVKGIINEFYNDIGQTIN